jgi:pimeloyl-ACP methyl ester carboxylesterase
MVPAMSTTTEIPLTEGFTQTGIRYVQTGRGPDVLLIGGLSDVVESWQPQLDGLADRYRLTAYDNRGFGQSTLPGDDEPYTIATMVQDAVDLLDHLGIERAHVAGFSGGGAVAQVLAIEHPERVRSLVLNGTFDHMDTHSRRLLGMWSRMAAAATDERTFLEDFFVFVYSPAAHESGWVDEAIEEALAYPHAPAPGAIERSIEAYKDHDARAGLPSIRVPALVLAGQYDMGATPRIVRRLADQIQDARYEVLPGAGHQQFQEDPELWNGKVDAFLRSV